jgi:hypothetical protein
MSRQEANLEILKRLQVFFEKEENKDQRFFQGLVNCNIVKFHNNNCIECGDEESKIIDSYNEESEVTLKMMK